MNKIKYFVLFIALTAMVPSCHQNENDDQHIQDSLKNELNDSLETVLAEKDSLMTLMNDINDGMAQIKDMQNIMSAQDLNHESADRKAQLSNEIAQLLQQIEAKEKRLKELEKRLINSSNYNEEMKKTITGLKAQLKIQEDIITDLMNQLKAAHIEIATLNTRVDSLHKVNDNVTREKEDIAREKAIVTQEKVEAQEEAAKANNELNTCFYAVGNKNTLKSNKIIETGFLRKTKILEGDFEKSYFTKADKRTLNKIDLRSKKVEVMSKHPADSYTIEETPNGKVLHITNSAKFWELSNYLVVKID
ncbi:MAG: hypothetical protein MJZ74_00445 [Muribaculaceae bacterium]|nr:hypothetical protein [Muribaculaceae bacterium]